MITITDINLPELDIYARLSEVQLKRLYEPQSGVFLAETATVISRALEAGYEPLSFLADVEKIHELSAFVPWIDRVPVYVAEHEVLKQLTGYELTRGLLCAMRRKELSAPDELLTDAHRVVVLENVMNPTNVGAIFRSAAALNMDALFLTQGCSDPLYRRSVRVSMGTVFQIPWTIFDKKISWPEKGIELLQKLGFKTAAMALCDDSVGIDVPELLKEEKLAVILGTEGDGLAAQTIADCDYTVKIPMSHGVDSLNVAAASAVAFWELGKRNI